MKRNWLSIALVGLLIALVVGCTQPYRITQELQGPIHNEVGCSVGVIGDELPIDVETDKKPTEEQIEKFRSYLEKQLSGSDLFSGVGVTPAGGAEAHGYEVSGGIIEYKRGSGFIRFLIAFGVGDAKLTVRLALVDRENGQTVFEANFKRVVSDWMQSGDKTFEMVAKDFVSALKKEMKRINKNG